MHTVRDHVRGWRRAVLCLAAPSLLAGASIAIAQPIPEAPAVEGPVTTTPEGPTRLPETVVEADATPTAEAPLATPPAPPPQAVAPADSFGLYEGAVGRSLSASSGFAGQVDIEQRPFARGADIIELVPNLFANEHAGGGKATEFFIRGVGNFHGTDFSLWVDGVPINLPSHAHGQGYSDINFVIPELVESINFRKGPYYVDVGDFSTTGSAMFHTVKRLEQGFTKLERGQYDYYRLVTADSTEICGGDLLIGFETRVYDGPWSAPEKLQKFTGMVKYSIGDEEAGMSLTAQAFNNQWTNANQIPERVVLAGASRFTNLSPTDGGTTNRYGLNGELWVEHDSGRTTLDVFSYYYDLTLYSNYTYFLEDPIGGDQFRQTDRRAVTGARLEHQWDGSLLGTNTGNTLGLWVRSDAIPEVSLAGTSERVFVEPIRSDEILETNLALYYAQELHWTDRLRTVHGVRGDFINFNVTSRDFAENSGNEWSGLAQPKLAVIWSPWDREANTDLFFNYGQGFHTNDARGVLTRLQANEETGVLEATNGVPGIVQTEGYEIGMQSAAIDGWNMTAAVYYLKLDSELVFEGDDGAVIPSQATERVGVEWNNWVVLTSWLELDGQLGYTHSRFVADVENEDIGVSGRFVPFAPVFLATAGGTVRLTERTFATLRYRHFGERALVEDNSIQSEPTNVFNLRLGYQSRRLGLGCDLLNLFNSQDPEISYFYTTRLAGEPADGVPDRINHPTLPFQWRCYLTLLY